MSLKFDPKVKEIQLLLNKKVGSTLKPDGLKGAYTSECVWMAKKAMGLEFNFYTTIITKEFTQRLVEAEDKSILPESFENLITPAWWTAVVIYEGNTLRDFGEKIYNWIKSKKKNTILNKDDIIEIIRVCTDNDFSWEHCIAHLINESAWGTSDRIKYYNNGFGIGMYNSGDKYRLKYLKIGTSAYEWCSLLNRLYIPRGQVNEQLLNLDYGRYGKNPEWFNLKEIPKGWYPYATSQSKSVSCGLLVREMREVLK